jgi:predicted RNA-binding protein YlxR (DUF448 family)
MVIALSMALDPSGSGPIGPVRTCIGCRRRSVATELFRVVVATDSTGGASSGVARVVPDPRHRFPGRGAWLHRDPGCVELAQRRKAFARALRAAGPVDAGAVVEHVAQAEINPVNSTTA